MKYRRKIRRILGNSELNLILEITCPEFLGYLRKTYGSGNNHDIRPKVARRDLYRLNKILKLG